MPEARSPMDKEGFHSHWPPCVDLISLRTEVAEVRRAEIETDRLVAAHVQQLRSNADWQCRMEKGLEGVQERVNGLYHLMLTATLTAAGSLLVGVTVLVVTLVTRK